MNVAALRESLLQKGVQLVAVSKYQPNEKLLFLYENGQRIFAENRVQEITSKYETLPKDIQWHLIGHLQRNNVKYIAPFVQMIHSVDSLALLEEIDKQAEKNNRVIDCLLQFHIAAEETKFGLNEAEARELLQSETVKDLQHIRICGVMGMGSFTEDTAQVERNLLNCTGYFRH